MIWRTSIGGTNSFLKNVQLFGGKKKYLTSNSQFKTLRRNW